MDGWYFTGTDEESLQSVTRCDKKKYYWGISEFNSGNNLNKDTVKVLMMLEGKLGHRAVNSLQHRISKENSNCTLKNINWKHMKEVLKA